MKKHAVNKSAVPAIHSIHSIVASQKVQETGKIVKLPMADVPPPPDEATIALLNKIAKESPFCFYYKSNSNGIL